MELGIMAVTLSVVVIILQVIIIALVVNTRKTVAKLAEARPQQSSDRQDKRNFEYRRDKRPQDNRPSNRPQQQQPQAAATSTAGADPVEKSLRDINLKLKNAERDQEFARRKVQESMPRENRPSNERRGNRDNNYRRDRRDNRDNNRKGNWQERQERRDFNKPQQQASTVAVEEEKQNFEIKSAEATQAVENTAVAATQAPEIAATDLGMNDENLQHGRKIVVKRRALQEDEKGSEGGAEFSSENTSDESAKTENESVAEGSVESEIKFGRR